MRCFFHGEDRFLFNIQKGFVGHKYKNLPYIVNVPMDPEDRPIPFHNMVYLGDGPSDIPCMSLLGKERGQTIGIYCEEDVSRIWALAYGRRANFTMEPNYSEGGSTYGMLRHVLMRIAAAIVRRIEFDEAELTGLTY